MKNIEQYIQRWVVEYKKNNGLLFEANTPSQEEYIMPSFNHDISDEKLVPTETFMETAYKIFNRDFFQNKLPNDLVFVTKSQPTAQFVGLASYQISGFDGNFKITPISITLNSSKTLTLHEWLEVVLHEMVHVVDYLTNPNRFFRFKGERRKYDPHGQWFLNYGLQFQKFGFNVQKYCNADVGINTDDKRVKSKMQKLVFLLLEGFETPSGEPAIMPISSSNLDQYVNFLLFKYVRGVLGGLKRIVVMKSENQSIVRLTTFRMKNQYSRMKWYRYNQKFIDNFGPFQEVDSYDVLTSKPKERIFEDRDETEYDDMNHINDKFAKEMYDHIDAIQDIKKIDDETYEVSIM